MKVLSQEDASLKLIKEATETESPKSRLAIQQTNIDLPVNGVYLESCIKCDDNYFVVTSDDCPFEESINLYLLSPDNKVLDSSVIFWPYGTGSFELIRVSEPNLVFFKFFAEKTWRVEIYREKHLSIPFFSEPAGVWRKHKFMRLFKISEQAKD